MFAGLELSCINNYFYKEAQSYIFDRVLNTTVYFTELANFRNSCPQVLWGKVFSKILKYSQEPPMSKFLFNKLQA